MQRRRPAASITRPVLLLTAVSLTMATVAPRSLLAQSDQPPASGDAQTAPLDAKAEANRRFEEGSKAFAEKRYKDAIDLFLEADTFVHNADLAYNTSLAYEAMGDASSALRWAREYLRRAPQAEDRAEVEKRRDALESKLRDKGVQQVTVLSTPPGATVVIDDAPVGVTPWTGDLHPGNHRAELRLEGHDKAQKSFELRPERAIDIEIAMVVARVNVVEPKKPDPVLPPETPWTATFTPVGIALLGVGAIGVGVAIGLEVARASAEADAREAEFQVDVPGHIDRAEDFQLGARVAIGIGSALVAAGGSMLIVGLVTGKRPAAAPAAVSWSGGCSEDGCGAAMIGRF